MEKEIILSIFVIILLSTNLTAYSVNADTDNHVSIVQLEIETVDETILQIKYDEIIILSPRAQMTQGVLPEDIICKDGLVLSIRSNDESVCVTEKTANKLNWQIIDIKPPKIISNDVSDGSNKINECSDLNKGAILISCDLRGVDLHGKNLSRADFSGADLSGADLSGANIMDAKFNNASLKNTKFSKAYLMNADFSGSDLSNADLSNADLSGASINNTKFLKTNLTKANLSGASLIDVNLSTVNLSYAKLDGTWLIDVNLIGANLTGVNVNTMNFNGLLTDLPGFDDRYIFK